jgi:hypothetical protein
MPGPGAPQGKRKRDPLPFIIIGVVLAVNAAICCLGGALVLFERRTTPTPSRTPAPPPPPNSGEPRPSPGASGSEGGGNPLSGAACLVGVWRETSHTSTATINGVSVQLRSTGSIQRFTADGVAVLDMGKGVTQSGKAGGDTYQVISKGTITFHYRTEPGVIYYSDPVGKGTTVWKRNGKQFESAQLQGSFGPESYSCEGDKLTENGEDYAIELDRVTGGAGGAGRPAAREPAQATRSERCRGSTSSGSSSSEASSNVL